MDDETREWIAKTDPERRRALASVHFSLIMGLVQTALLFGIFAAIILK